MIGSKSRVTARICGAGTPVVKAVVIPPLRSNNSQGLLGTREAPEIQRDQTVWNPKTHGYVTGWVAPQNFHKFQNELRALRWFQGHNFQTKPHVHALLIPCWNYFGSMKSCSSESRVSGFASTQNREVSLQVLPVRSSILASNGTNGCWHSRPLFFIWESTCYYI